MTPGDVAQYLTCKYEDGGEGPIGYNCWGLLRHVERVHFGRNLPAMIIGDAIATREVHDDALSSGLYWLIDKPEHGQPVLMRGGNDPHVGVWLDFDGGGVLHAMKGYGVVWTLRNRLNSIGFGRMKYYRIRNAGTLCSSERSVSPID
jgi:hypothetical protein